MIKSYECTSCNTIVSVDSKSYPRSVFLCEDCKETEKHTKTCKGCGASYDDRQEGCTIFTCKSCIEKKEEEKHFKTCKTCGEVYDVRHEGSTVHNCGPCRVEKERARYMCTCDRCGKEYDRREEYKNHQGYASRDYCKSCLDEMKEDYAELLIWRAYKIKEKYDRSNIQHSLRDEVKFKTKMSRNDIRIFGWNTGLISQESIDTRKYESENNVSDKDGKNLTYDHINGMTSIMTATIMRILENILKNENDVVKFLDQMSCVTTTTSKINNTDLKKLQVGEVTPEAYYNALGGLHYQGRKLTLEEFKRDFSHYFIGA